MTEQNIQSLPVGYILEKKYQILNVIGSGAFGITYLVRHLTFANQYVIKEYLPQVAIRDETEGIKPINEQDKELFDWGLKQFIKEAKLLNQLKHPNVVTVIDIFEDNGSAYFVMPFLGKYTLSQWIDNHPHPTVDELCQIFIPLLEGLKYIHEKELYHSDIKPENILITDHGAPILIDFGSARHPTLGGGDAMVLTPPYAPIEQYSSKDEFKPASDLYSLMVCLYEAITKKLIPEATERISQDNFQKLSTDRNYQNEYPTHFLQAIDKALSINTENRQQSAMILQHELLNYQDDDPQPEQQSKLIPYLFAIIVLVLGGGGYYYQNNNKQTAIQLNDFDYQTSLPINGEKNAVIELKKDHYTLNIIELDQDKNWKFVNHLSFEYMEKPDVLLREIQYKVLNFGINKQLNIVVQSDDINNTNIKQLIDYINFAHSNKSKDIVVSTLSEKQTMEYLFTQNVPAKYQKNSVLLYKFGDKNIFIFKDVNEQFNFYNQIDKALLQQHRMGYIFIVQNQVDSKAPTYQPIKDKSTLPKEISELPLTPIWVNTNIGISILLKKGM